MISPSSWLVGAGSGRFTDSDGNEKKHPTTFNGLFCNGAGDGLKGLEKTRRMAMLYQRVVSLNQEFKKADLVLAMHWLRGLFAPTKIHVKNQEAKGEIET